MTAESQRNYNNKEGDEISLKELLLKIQAWWHYLLIKWKTILFFGLIGGVFGFTYAYFKKPIYTATTSFVLEDEKGTSGGLGSLVGLASMAGVDLGGSGGGIFQGDNILGLYKSRNILEKTLLTQGDFRGKKQLLVDRYIDFNNLKEKWKKIEELKTISFTNYDPINDSGVRKQNRLLDSVLKIIVKDINTNYLTVSKPDKKLSAIQVDVKSVDESFAKVFNDELVKNVNEFYIKTKIKKTVQNIKILQNKTDSVRAVMNGAIYTSVSIVDATPNLNPTRQVQRLAPVQRAQLSAETNKTILAELVKNLELSKISLLKETPLIQVIDQPIFPLDIDIINPIKATIIGFFMGALIYTTILLLSLLKNAFFKS